MAEHIADAELARAWDEEGEHWATNADRYDASVAAHHDLLLSTAAIGVEDRVLDLGCGCGQTTRDAARRATAGHALGVDLSTPMLRVAQTRAREEALANVTFERSDAQIHPFPPSGFDVVISRFGAMFFTDLAAAFENVGRAVRPGGRVAIVSWTDLDANEWLTVLRTALAAGRELPAPPVGAPGPFGLGNPEATKGLLTAAGFENVASDRVELPFVAGANAEDAYAFVGSSGVARGLLEDLDDATRAAALESLHAALEAHETPRGVVLGSSVWLITATKR